LIAEASPGADQAEGGRLTSNRSAGKIAPDARSAVTGFLRWQWLPARRDFFHAPLSVPLIQCYLSALQVIAAAGERQ